MFSDPQKNIEQFNLGPGNYVADFGSGQGHYTFAAAKAVGLGGKVYSIDVQKDILEKLKSEASTKRINNIEVVWANIEKVGGTRLRDNSMDAVIAANVFFQLENKNESCLEIRRILKPGGRLLLVDWSNSFGNMGPQSKDVFYKEKAVELFEKNGFAEDRTISAGSQHYGIIFRKK